MTLTFSGPLLSPPFVTRELPLLLAASGTAADGDAWHPMILSLRRLAGTGGAARVLDHVIRPLAIALGYAAPGREEAVPTPFGPEDGGWRLRGAEGVMLRAWTAAPDTPLDAATDRLSPVRRAGRVLRARGESAGLLTNGEELRLMLRDPAGLAGEVSVALPDWPGHDAAPESWRLFAALASPRGVAGMDRIFEAARLHQTGVTRALRESARAAVESFLAAVLERSDPVLWPDAETLWRQTLILVWRLLFILKLEAAPAAGQGFSFAASAAWRRGLSPRHALAPLVRRHLDLGHDTGRMLEDGLRHVFQLCREGLRHPVLSIAPLGGGLFAPEATAALDRLSWGERAVALLLDHLLWTVTEGVRERVHYGALDVEELGHVYEALLDLEPAIATTPMTRARHGRTEAVLPASPCAAPRVAAGTFFLRAGPGRRAGGSYYTPNAFTRHLVRAALHPRVTPLAEAADPAAILRVKVFDPAMGSGHFLVEACRFLAAALHEACRRCDASPDPAVRARLDALPDRDGRLAAWLPSRSRGGVAGERARALCRRLVAVHCLYGADQDPMAVSLAKLSLWLESHAEGLPLTFLDHRLVTGDSLGGPFFRDMDRLPVGGAPLDPLLARGLSERLSGQVARALEDVRLLDSSVGGGIAEVLVKQAAHARLETVLRGARALAHAWSGAVADGGRDANDLWLDLARAVADTGDPPDTVRPRQAALLAEGGSVLPLDLMFPEIFRPTEVTPGGFDAVLGNPPWEVVHHQSKEYFATLDPRVMDAPTKRERAGLEAALLADPAIRDGFTAYKHGFTRRKRLSDRLFPGAAAGGSVDLFQIFTERMLDCTRPDGALAVVVPSSFHANEGTAGLRRRLLDTARLESCFGFENRRKLFDIHGRLKFSLLVARRGGVTERFRCGFYLDTIGQVNDPARVMIYDRAFVRATGGAGESFLELRGAEDQRVARRLFLNRPSLRAWLEERGLAFGREAHMTGDSHRFTPIGQVGGEPALTLHEGKTFHQFTDRWNTAPRYAIRLKDLADKPRWSRAATQYRLAFREIARSTDERTMIAAILPPGHVMGHKATCEKTPWTRPNAQALLVCAVFNSFTFDWCVRRKAAASVSLFMVHACPAPVLTAAASRFLTHGALRLSYRADIYDALWREQLGARAVPPGDASLRAAMDAVIARGFGLGREDYAHVLMDFSHKSWPEAPELCLSAYDALAANGAAAFYKRYDPFARVPSPDTLSDLEL